MAYCVKCKDKREMKNTHQITMKNGKPAMQGECVICGTRLNRILPASAASSTSQQASAATNGKQAPAKAAPSMKQSSPVKAAAPKKPSSIHS
jgi:hypothetical protein